MRIMMTRFVIEMRSTFTKSCGLDGQMLIDYSLTFFKLI